MASPSSKLLSAAAERTESSANPNNYDENGLQSEPSSHLDSPATKSNPTRYSAIEDSSNPSNPFSAFYQHPNTRSSLERAKAESRTDIPIMQQQHYQADLESGTTQNQQQPPAIIVMGQPGNLEPSTSVPPSCNTSTDGGSSRLMAGKGGRRPEYKTCRSQSSVWPTRQELEEKALITKRERMRRNWNCLSGLSKKQRIWVRVLLGVVVLCAAVGIGIGVSLAVGGGIWKGNGQQESIPNSDNK